MVRVGRNSILPRGQPYRAGCPCTFESALLLRLVIKSTATKRGAIHIAPLFCTPYRIRTGVAHVRGGRPRPLDERGVLRSHVPRIVRRGTWIVKLRLLKVRSSPLPRWSHFRAGLPSSPVPAFRVAAALDKRRHPECN